MKTCDGVYYDYLVSANTSRLSRGQIVGGPVQTMNTQSFIRWF